MRRRVWKIVVLVGLLCALGAGYLAWRTAGGPRALPSGTPRVEDAQRVAKARAAAPLTLQTPRPTAASLRAAVKGTNVVVVVLDAARADHFGAYGYPRETTPTFDALARQALVFDQHFCQYPQTSPSTACLFTGQYPDTHGVAVPRSKDPKDLLQPLDWSTYTLDWVMGDAGFRTLAFTASPAALPVLGLGYAFQTQYSPLGAVRNEQDDKLWRDPNHLLGLIRSNLTSGMQQFYAYVHFLQPHNPYEMPTEFAAPFRGQPAPNYWEGEPAFSKVYGRWHDEDPPATGSDWVNLYDANLRWGDWALGQLIAYLKQQKLWDNTLLIVTADHGEALGEHGYQWHATCPYEEALRVPLLVKFPGAHPPVGRVNALTQIIDVLPTVLDLYDLPPQPSVQGKSLVPLMTGEATKINDYVFTRTNGQYPCYVARDQHSALLLYQGGKMRALYDLDEDPREVRNIITEQPQRAGTLLRAFLTFAETQRYQPLDFVDPQAKPSQGGAKQTLSQEAQRQLKSLGYLK